MIDAGCVDPELAEPCASVEDLAPEEDGASALAAALSASATSCSASAANSSPCDVPGKPADMSPWLRVRGSRGSWPERMLPALVGAVAHWHSSGIPV